jgi:hypothetical protein
MVGERTVNKALIESLQLEAVKIAAGTFIRLQQTNTRTVLEELTHPNQI